MSKSRTIAAFLGAFWFCAVSAEAKLFEGEEFYLDNGMRVIVLPNHRAPVVKHLLLYKAGSIDEEPGKGGSAHLLEHLMFRGTKKIPDGKLNEIFNENGVESNAFTSFDMTGYHEFSDISRLELAMFAEADRLSGLKLDPQSFKLERDIVYQERQQRFDNNPTGYFQEALRRSLWQEHPYARPVAGSSEEIMKLTSDDVQAFYDRYYTPQNAILVLAGDIDVLSAKQLAEKYYGKLKERAEKNERTFPELKEGMKLRLDMALPKVQSVRLFRVYAAASTARQGDEVVYLDFLQDYLGGGETSRLYRKLVKEKPVALAVGSSYDGTARSYGTFSFSMLPAPGVSPEEGLEALEQAVTEALAELKEEDVEKYKEKTLNYLIYLNDNPENLADAVGQQAVSGLSLNEIADYDEELKRLNVKDVRKTAKKLLHQAPMITGILRPLEEKS